MVKIDLDNIITLQEKPEETSEPEQPKESVKEQIESLVGEIRLVSMEQIYRYFDRDDSLVTKENGYRKGLINRAVRELLKEKKIFPAEEVVPPGGSARVPCGRFVPSEQYVPVKRHVRLERFYKSLWVYLDMRNSRPDEVGEVFAVDPSIADIVSLTFLMGHNVYDIMYIPEGTESRLVQFNMIRKDYIKKRYLPPKEMEGLHRVALITDDSQIRELLGYGILGLEYIAVMKEDGDVKYKKSRTAN